MKNTSTQKAFSIVELMVVVTIMAILLGIITSNLASSKSKSRDAKRISDITQLQLALELFFDRCNRYPIPESIVQGGVTEVVPKLDDPASTNLADGCPPGIKLSTFTSKIPIPPVWGDYDYEVDQSNHPLDYVLRAKLENNGTALVDDIDVNPTNIPSLPANYCADTSSGWFYCVQPR